MVHDAAGRVQGSDHAHDPWRRARRLAVVAFAWTTLVGLALLVAPLGESQTVTSASTGIETSTTSHETLLEHEGTWVVLLLAVPVLLALLALRAPRRWAGGVRRGTGVVLTALCIIGSASLGLFYLPAAVLILVSGLLTPSARRR